MARKYYFYNRIKNIYEMAFTRNVIDDKVLKITNDVSWVGILDSEITSFDIVMETEFGTTYNSYFIDADKKVLVETVKEKFFETYLLKIQEVTNPADIDYIVLNHTEPDHSGSLVHLLKLAPKAVVVGSGQAIKYLDDIVGHPFKSLIVKDGDTLDLGNKTLKFIGAPNLHWPDSMYTYLVEDRMLFTCDSFGAHYCDKAMFDDLTGPYDAAFRYYFDVILKPFSRFMLKAIEKIEDLPIEIIAPGHGPILRSSWKEKVELSKRISEEYIAENTRTTKKVLIAYVSAYGYTAEMAGFIAEGIRLVGNVDVELLDIEKIQLGELDSKLVGADALMLGCPTLNQNILLPVYKLFALINPLRDRGKPAAAFGSYGWSGEGSLIIDGMLKSLKLNVVLDPKPMKFRPGSRNSHELIDYGRQFAEKIQA